MKLEEGCLAHMDVLSILAHLNPLQLLLHPGEASSPATGNQGLGFLSPPSNLPSGSNGL